MKDILSVPQEHMCNCCSNGQVRANLSQHLRAREPRKTLFRKLIGIEHEVLIEDECLFIASAVLVEKLLGEEGEVLAVPDIRCVARAECDPRKKTNVKKPNLPEKEVDCTYMQMAVPAYSDNCVESGVNKAPIEPPPDPT